METIIAVNSAINGFVWGPIMLALLVGTGVYLSIRVGFIQFSKIGYWWKNTIGKIFKKSEAGKGEITPLQAVSTALASTVGTGNIAGVTGAIILGGPGAVFWMWISALFGMVTKFAEVTLAVKYRERNEKGDWCGGPMYYIKNGLGANCWASFSPCSARSPRSASATFPRSTPSPLPSSPLRWLSMRTPRSLTRSSA